MRSLARNFLAPLLGSLAPVGRLPLGSSKLLAGPLAALGVLYPPWPRPQHFGAQKLFFGIVFFWIGGLGGPGGGRGGPGPRGLVTSYIAAHREGAVT